MSEDPTILLEVDGPVARIVLNRPDAANALTLPMTHELMQAAIRCDENPDVRAIVVTGAGSFFCAGGDLKSFAASDAIGAALKEMTAYLHAAISRLARGNAPVIAAVNGHAFGGGIGLVAAADIAIAAEGAKFSFSEVRLGLIPAIISVVVLQKIGVHDAMRLFLTGERFEAERARGYGLVHRVVALDGLREAVREEAKKIALGGPNAVAEAKRLIRTVSQVSMEEGFTYAEAKIAELFASAEAAEGMGAFVQKRPPKWAE
jgi:enoyl-CoA hydratase/carnithine racemase